MTDMSFSESTEIRNIVVVGGGAGGLELVTKLGRKLGKEGKVSVTLVDRNRIHIWKPLLHEVATGTLDSGTESVVYHAHAARNGYNFELGELIDVNTCENRITLGLIVDANGNQLLSERTIEYDTLVLALGSLSNDFGIKGVKENCYFLDSYQQAERFQNALINKFTGIHQLGAGERLRIAIVGAGATGVELAAELYHVTDLLKSHGMPRMSRDQLEITLIEAGLRVLPALPERISVSVASELEKLGVKIRTSVMVSSATREGLHTNDGELFDADLIVWAAGVKAPDFISGIEGLTTNRSNQIVVEKTLQASGCKNIWVIGDCCSFTQENGKLVPPRAQAAHQMASTVFTNIIRASNGRNLKDYRYKDHGSLVSLSRFSAVGNLMGNLHRNSLFIEGRVARLFYVSLYRMHQFSIHGYLRGVLVVLTDRIAKVVRPKMKLH
ncbi:NADH dehydrogenase [Marinobacterium nitratireducens]|uniref:NADH dehydrogenase n=1 Tax=Marinobacterium nitratireducens TaxID=518897 RepID=A0A917ZK88_9GAMM|nr:NAD(P)/FAD-dependent oxidoreductase [Marinobacterium nitratireducens]GGO84416.1 NADH dehydrogenase [Marinobacterium nitratireducens]